jgi:hypothetical protein
VARGIHEGYGSEKFGLSFAIWAGGICGITTGHGTFGTFVESCVCVSQSNGDTALYLLAVLVGPYMRKLLSESGLAMVNVTDHPYIHFRLS